MAGTAMKICLLGSGNWGTAVAKIIGLNVLQSTIFQRRVDMYVFEEIVNGKKLSDIINETHENVKYLPNVTLPENVVAVTSVQRACESADVLVFAVPHQYVVDVCSHVKGNLPENAVGISLIKGLAGTGSDLQLISNVIASNLGIHCSVLMGANIANEVALESFSEATVGCSNEALWPMWKSLFQCSYFQVNCVADAHSVEICGALKNVVALGAGILEGLGHGINTKAALIRSGLAEIRKFSRLLSGNVDDGVFFESCGFPDLVATCYGGRNSKLAAVFAKTGKALSGLEQEMLNGQKLQGLHTAEIVFKYLAGRRMEKEFPLLESIYRVCCDGQPTSTIIDGLRSRT